MAADVQTQPDGAADELELGLKMMGEETFCGSNEEADDEGPESQASHAMSDLTEESSKKKHCKATLKLQWIKSHGEVHKVNNVPSTHTAERASSFK